MTAQPSEERGRQVRITPLPALLLTTCGVALLLWQPWRRDAPEGLISEATAAIDAGRLDEAAELIDRLDESAETAGAVPLLRGLLLLKQDRPREALRELEQAQIDGTSGTATWMAQGEALYRLGRLSEALPLFQRIVAADGGNLEARRWLGAIYYDIGAMDSAILEMQSIVRETPEDYRPHYALGVIYLDFERYGLAADHLATALDLNPPSQMEDEIAVGAARALVKDHRYEEALSQLESVSFSADADALRANCLVALGQVREARALLRDILERRPDHRDALLLRGELAVADGREEGAIDDFQRILDSDAHDFEARYELAQAFAALGDVERQKSELKRMEESRGLVLRLARLSSQAIEEPYNAGLRTELANVCRELGKTELAEMWARAAAELQAMGADREGSLSE
ncbi:MAG: tetratricopeptide repeat protein [Planctomycetota bacterium]|nr:MAG: tetratricopeptide repeat protein [Planctomycetota bacterium]REK31333.1 MAG: tetratricopeptide repeat protein [Planctomycetota bacterium]REK39058.1 MAG: tetratricopeptide repeat protein [Planctomycetota bacterium]